MPQLRYKGQWNKGKVKVADVPSGHNEDGSRKMVEIILDADTFPEKKSDPILIEVPNQEAVDIIISTYPDIFEVWNEPVSAPAIKSADKPASVPDKKE